MDIQTDADSAAKVQPHKKGHASCTAPMGQMPHTLTVQRREKARERARAAPLIVTLRDN